MVTRIDTFVLAVAIGFLIGSINAYFRYTEHGRVAALKTFLGWLIAFTITGLIASPIAAWLIPHLF